MSLASRLGIQINHPPRGDAPREPVPRPAVAAQPAPATPPPPPPAAPQEPQPEPARETWNGRGLGDDGLPSRMLPALGIGAAAALAGLIVVLRRRR